MYNVTVVPIDNRPVCYDLIKQTALSDKNINLSLPPEDLLGGLTKNSDINGIINWIESLENTDFLIASLDTIAYGGLIPSRRSTDSFDIVKSRIDKFVQIIKEKNIKVFASSSIMRISNNNVNEEEKEYWSLYGEKIFKYSYKYHKTGNKTSNDIPSWILNDYLNTRNRNFNLNKYYIELKKQGVFDTLVFSKDDCAEFGLNVMEAEELKKLSFNIDNVFIKTGADEIPLVLFSRAVNSDKKIKIAPVYMNPDSINKISKYEDISVKEAVETQIELAGAFVSDVNNADLILLVNNFKNEQGELVMNKYEPLFEGDLILPDKSYFIADILNANGADNNFVNKLFEIGDWKNFLGYAAWNTTGNTLGSAISCAMTYFKAKNPNKNEFIKLQIIRFLDDWAYQANIRSKIREKRENLSSDILKSNIKPFETVILKKLKSKNINPVYSFPWNRFFEIEINL